MDIDTQNSLLETVMDFIFSHPILSAFIVFVIFGILFGKTVIKDLEAKLAPTEDFMGTTKAYGEIEFKEYKGGERALEVSIKQLADFEGKEISVHAGGAVLYNEVVKNGRIFAQLSTKKDQTNLPDLNHNDAVTVKIGMDTVLKGVFVPD